MSGSSHTQQQQTYQQGPWAPTSQALADMVGGANTLYGQEAAWQPFGGYQGQTYAGFTPAQLQAQGDISNIATSDRSAVSPANAMLNFTEGGGFLSAGNPYFQGMENSVAQSVLPQLDSQWAKAGRFSGNEEAPQAIGKGLTAAMMPYAYQNYTQERENQMKGTTVAPSLDQAQYTDPRMLYGVGSEQQQMNQQAINQAIAAGTWNQQQPANAWQNYLGNLGYLGNMGRQGSGSTYGTATPSTMQEIFGGGMAGAGIMGSMFPSGGSGGGGGGGGGGMMNMMPSFGSMMPWLYGGGAGAAGGAADMAGGALAGTGGGASSGIAMALM